MQKIFTQMYMCMKLTNKVYYNSQFTILFKNSWNVHLSCVEKQNIFFCFLS